MSSPADETTTTHPLAAFVDRLRARLDTLGAPGSRPVWGLTGAEQRHVLTELATAQAQLDAIRLQVLAEADRSGATDADAALRC